MKTESFVRTLGELFPSLKPLLEEHLADNFGELLPHVFFGNFVTWILTMFASARLAPGSSSRRELAEVLQLLEETYSGGDDELQELLSVSFLESLPRLGEEGSGIREWLGPSLTKQLQIIG